jgi:hypothetical protein
MERVCLCLSFRGALGRTGSEEMPRLERHRGAQGVKGGVFAPLGGGTRTD